MKIFSALSMLPDSKVENSLMEILRKVSSKDFFEAIEPLLSSTELKKVKAGLRLVRRRNLEKKFLKRILLMGLKKAIC